MDQELKTKYTADMTEWDAAVAKAKADLALLDGYLRKSAQAHTLSARATKEDAVAQTQLIASLNSLKRGLSDATAQLTKNTTAAKSNSDSLGKTSKVADQAGISIGSLAKGYLTFSAVMGAGRVFLESTKDVQKYENQLKVASGTQEDFAKNTQFLEGLAAKYNKNVIDLGSNFAKLTIATRGTNLEGAQTEKLFAAVTATSAALQMSVDDTNGTFNAFIQMVSKGNVQAEELRGQLGERLYGAFNLAAKSMGVTTKELNKMLEQGQVLAADLLPKLTVELENTFGAKAEENAHNLGSAIEYATGQLTLLIAEAGKTSGITGFFTQATQDAGGFLSKLRDVTKEYGLLSALAATAVGGVSSLSAPFMGGGPAFDPLSILSGRAKGKGATSGGVIGQQSNTSSEDYAKQFGIRDTSAKAEAKLKQAAETTANKAATALNKWVSEQIQIGKDILAEKFLEIEQQNQPDYKFHGTLGAIGMAQNRGITTGLDNDLNPTQKFSSDTGNAVNFDTQIAGMSAAVDQMLIQQNRLKKETSDFGTELNDSIQSSFASAIESTISGVGQLAVGLATGTADLSDVGNAFAGIMAGLFDTIGKALASYAATILVADIAIGSMNAAGALIGAGLAFAAGAVARASIKDAGAQGLWTGGIVQGMSGKDRVPIMASAGEAVITQSQQSNLMGILNGAHTGRSYGGSRSDYGGSGKSIQVEVVGRLKSGDIDFAGKRGARKNNYFR